MKNRVIALAVLAVIGFVWFCFYHGIAHFLGIDTQQSDNYDFVSGVGPMIVTAVGYTGILGALVRHINCHARGCWRIARYPVAGGDFKVCQRHHPDPAVRDGASAAHIAHKHAQHLLRKNP